VSALRRRSWPRRQLTRPCHAKARCKPPWPWPPMRAGLLPVSNQAAPYGAYARPAQVANVTLTRSAWRSKFPSSARSGLMERKSSGNGRRPQLFFGLCAKSSDLPWPAGGHGLQPQLQAREPAAHTGTVSEQCLEPNRAKFSRQLKRISVQMDSVVRVSPPSVSNASGSLKTARHVRLCRADNLVTVSEARPPAEPAAIPATGWIANPAHRKLAQTAGVCTGSNG
jgi:hypothetical protein